MTIKSVRNYWKIISDWLAGNFQASFKKRRAALALVLACALLLLAGSAVATPSHGEVCGRKRLSVNGLSIDKDAHCEILLAWEWTLTRPSGLQALTLAKSQVYTLNTAVTAAARMVTVYRIQGQITLTNYKASSITINAVHDNLAPVICNNTLPHTLGPLGVLHCWYDQILDQQPSENIAVIARDGANPYQLVVPLMWSAELRSDQKIVDACAFVSGGEDFSQEKVCIGETESFTFPYNQQVGPYQACGEHTANSGISLTTGDTGVVRMDDGLVTVQVPCNGGCTLPVEYWRGLFAGEGTLTEKNWEVLDLGDYQFLDTGRSYLQVMLMATREDDPYVSLAQAYITADLNRATGAAMSANVERTFEQARILLNRHQDTHSIRKTIDQSLALHLISILDNYNNGLAGPGPCSQ